VEEAMTELVEFLLARIADDEQDARGTQVDIDRWRRENEINGVDGSQGSITVASLLGTAMDPARVLAECAAKRRIVELHGATMVKQWMNPFDGPAYQEEEWSCETCGWFETGSACDTLRALASIYVDHPDFRPEWRL
jgi:hypothetical protein